MQREGTVATFHNRTVLSSEPEARSSLELDQAMSLMPFVCPSKFCMNSPVLEFHSLISLSAAFVSFDTRFLYKQKPGISHLDWTWSNWLPFYDLWGDIVYGIVLPQVKGLILLWKGEEREKTHRIFVLLWESWREVKAGDVRVLFSSQGGSSRGIWLRRWTGQEICFWKGELRAKPFTCFSKSSSPCGSGSAHWNLEINMTTKRPKEISLLPSVNNSYL